MKPTVKEKIQVRPKFLYTPRPSPPTEVNTFTVFLRKSRNIVKEKRNGKVHFGLTLAPPIPFPMFQTFLMRPSIKTFRKRIINSSGRVTYTRFFHTGLAPVVSAVFDFIISSRRKRGR